jgi:hypothetical protein
MTWQDTIPVIRSAHRKPAMALGLNNHIWEVRDLLHYPVPQVA